MAGKANVTFVWKGAYRVLFSFLVPVYNTEEYLETCVNSLLAQKGCPYEVILLDDGSTDSSGAICDRYAAQYPDRIRVIHKANEGLLMTRRRGFTEARGDWFICVDSDDYVAPELLEAVISAIESNDGCDMVMYNYQYVDDAGVLSPSRLQIPDGTVFAGEAKQKLFEARLTGTAINNMWLRAIHRSIVDITGDYSSLGIRNMCEDAVQVLPLYTNTQKTVFLDRPLYYYRKADGSITSRTTLAHWQAIHRSFVLEEPYAQRWQVAASVQNKRYTKQLENFCNCIRWLYRQEEADIPAIVRKMKEESLFQLCMEHYEKKYASSRYSAFCVPIIAAAADRERFGFLAFWFRLEKWLRR